MSAHALDTARDSSDRSAHGFMPLPAIGVTFLPIPVGRAFEAGGRVSTVKPGAPLSFEKRARRPR